jgi:thiamine-monophosphate kinase
MPDDPGESFVWTTLLRDAGPGSASDLRVPPGDDAAVLADGLVLTQDAFIEGVHWDARFTGADVGWRLAMANLSDLNAMGARAVWAMLSIALPKPLDRPWVKDFSLGFSQALDQVPLIGGDTCSSPGPKALSVTLAGRLTAEPIRRTGAQVGDEIWVSGQLGAAAGGYYDIPELRAAFLRPAPPLGLGPALAERGLVTSGMDLSDGLCQDLHRLCAASGVSAAIDPAALPLPNALMTRPAPLMDAVGFGEDFELLFTAAASHHAALAALAAELRVPLTCIGHIQAGRAPPTLGKMTWPVGWSHFGPETT